MQPSTPPQFCRSDSRTVGIRIPTILMAAFRSIAWEIRQRVRTKRTQRGSSVTPVWDPRKLDKYPIIPTRAERCTRPAHCPLPTAH
jgi:hypothetical protein